MKGRPSLCSIWDSGIGYIHQYSCFTQDLNFPISQLPNSIERLRKPRHNLYITCESDLSLISWNFSKVFFWGVRWVVKYMCIYFSEPSLVSFRSDHIIPQVQVGQTRIHGITCPSPRLVLKYCSLIINSNLQSTSICYFFHCLIVPSQSPHLSLSCMQPVFIVKNLNFSEKTITLSR